jgi:hypothetical protein
MPSASRSLSSDVSALIRAAGFDPPPGVVARFLGEGCDFRAFRIGDRAYRIAKHEEAARALEREVPLGRWLAPALPCTISFVERFAPDYGIAEYALLTGRPAHRAPPTDALASDLAALLTALHTLDADQARALGAEEIDAPIVCWQEVAQDELDRIPHERWVRDAIENSPVDGGARVLAHTDLSPEHVLVDEHGRLDAVLDWSSAAISDAAIDLAAAWQWGDASFAARVLEEYGGPRDPELDARARYLALCAAIHGIYVGFTERRDDLHARAQKALTALRPTFV